MNEVDRVLSEFIDDWNAGRRPRAEDWLERVDESSRDELADALMEWLAIAPTPDYDEAMVAQLRADPAVAAVVAGVAGDAGAWPLLLPRLRERAGLAVRELAGRVTAAFGLAGQEGRAVTYLERMERGELDATRVSRRLLEALGEALGVSAAALAEAGDLRGPPARAVRFRAAPAAAADMRADFDTLSRAAMAPAPAPMDELDRLFLGGPDA
jgi:transcriptional regulator with XRE-family HTH domain